MKGLLITVGFFGLCFGMPSSSNGDVEVMTSSGGLPPVQSGIPSGSNVEAMPTNAGSMTRPSWPGSYQPGGPIYSNQYPSSGQTFQPYTSSGGCSSGGCSSGGSSSYPSMNTYPSYPSYPSSGQSYPSYPSSGQSYPSYTSGGCSSGGCSSGSTYPAPQPVYNTGWTTGTGGSGFNPGYSTGVSTLPVSISNPGMSAPVYRPCSSSTGGGCGSGSGSQWGSSYPVPMPAYGGCGSSSTTYGTMVGSMMPPCSRNRRPSYSMRPGRFSSWGSKQQFTKPMPAISSGMPSISSGLPVVSSGFPYASSGTSSVSSVSSSSSSGGCSSSGSCGK